MKTRSLTGFLACIGVVSLVGCGDPLVGKWESKDDSDVDLDIEEVDGGYRGDGHINACVEIEGEYYCAICPIEFEAEESGDNEWEVSGEFTGECAELGSFDGIECELNDAGDELECRLPGNGGTIEYEKDE